MHIGNQTQAVLLLTVPFGKSDTDAAKPLSTGEWARLARWLKDHELQPSSLVSADVAALLSGWMDRSITTQRIQRLLDRGGLLGLSLEKWERTGLWVLTRSDLEYPERLKRRLRLDSPPVLFGCGSKTLLNASGIAVVGSRDASQQDLDFAGAVGRDAAAQGLSVISGGARGVDQNAMLGALQREGTAVGVLADSLLRSATSPTYRKYLMSNDLALVSPFSPEAGFNVGTAMARNRYIYCLSDAAIVVTCSRDKGGTWNGAVENLKAGWVPLWVKRTEDVMSGNADLVRRGANWLTNEIANMDRLFTPEGDLSKVTVPIDAAATDSLVEKSSSFRDTNTSGETPVASPSLRTISQDISFYRLFLERMSALTDKNALNAQELAQQLDLTKQQVSLWLKRALADEAVRKIGRPVRYRCLGQRTSQPSLFSDD